MKRTVLILTACLLSGYMPLSAQKKSALIVAIGDYPSTGGWGKISSDKDVPLIKKALITQGFEEKNIGLLSDSSATKKGIIKAIQDLTARVSPGDIVVFHYSGHGQQVIDKNGDEMDRKDESIVPFDAPSKYIKGVYEGQNHLTDDELESLFNDLRFKLGKKGSLMVILDACHSGTATRGTDEGAAPARGTFAVLAPDDFVAPNVQDTGMMNTKVQTRGGNDDNLSPFVVFSGASAHQLNYETKDEQGNFVGSLSYTISKALINAKTGSSYQGLFDMVKVDMSVLAPKQSPQVEGDINNQLFAGEVKEMQRYFKVENWLDNKTVTLQGGQMMGLHDNSRVSFYDIDTRDIKNAKPKATGTVKNSSLIRCDVILDQPLEQDKAVASWVYVTEQNFGNMEVTVKIDLPKDENLKVKLTEKLKVYEGVIRIEDKNPDLVIEANNKNTRGNQIQIITNNEMVLFNKNVDANVDAQANEITRNLLSYAQAKFIRGLEMEEASINLSFELIPITQVEETEQGEGRFKTKKVMEKSRGKIEEKMVNGMITFKEGDYFKIKVTNNGNEPAYFNILDIQPDNQINVLIPGKKETSEEYKVRPGESIELEKMWKISPPFGTENFKIIASKEPLNLRNIIHPVTSRGESAKTARSPMEVLLLKTYQEEGTRGSEEQGETDNIPQESVHIRSVVFRITK